jgi:hypothetical protein
VEVVEGCERWRNVEEDFRRLRKSSIEENFNRTFDFQAAN